jgi:two-component system OmpR family sensor kinase
VRLLRGALGGYLPEAGWLVFALANLAAMVWMNNSSPRYQGWQTVPFHFIYVSFTLLYGLRAWRAGRTMLGLLFVMTSTGILTVMAVLDNRESVAELMEVPLMALMFAAMVYHVFRRQQATAIAEALAIDRQRLLDREHAFISDASHELRTPLTIIRGHVELLNREPDAAGDVVAERHDIVLGELERVDRLVDRLLLLEGSFSPRFLRPRPLSADDFVTSVFRRWSGTADRRWLMGTVAAGTVPIDADQLTAALDAVLENAVAHTQPGDSIRLDADAHDDRLVIGITDGGSGIAPEALPRIFDRFYRGDQARNRRTGGAGLGLCVTRAIVRAHGGEIEATSSPGRGTRFAIWLPGFRGEGEPVPGAANGFDLDRGHQLSPQPANVDIHNV